MEIEQAFGQVLRQLRNSKGLSQEELAHQSGLDRTFISLLERGLRRPTITTLFTLSSKLDISPADFIAKVQHRLNYLSR